MKKKIKQYIYIWIILTMMFFFSYTTISNASAIKEAYSTITQTNTEVTSDKFVDIFENLGIHIDYYKDSGNKEQVLQKMNDLSDADLIVLSTYEDCTNDEEFMNVLVRDNMGPSSHGLGEIYQENANYFKEIASHAKDVYNTRQQSEELEVDKIKILEDLEIVMTSYHTLEELYDMRARIQEYNKSYKDTHGSEDPDRNLNILYDRLLGLIEDDKAHPEDDLTEDQLDIRDEGTKLAEEGYFAKNNQGVTLPDLYDIEKRMIEYRQKYPSYFDGESDYIVGEYLKDVQALIVEKGGTPTSSTSGGEEGNTGEGGTTEGGTTAPSGGTTEESDGNGSNGTDTSNGENNNSDADDDEEEEGTSYTVSGIVINPGTSGINGSDLTNPADDPDAYKPGELETSATLLKLGGIITGALKIIGIIAAVVTLVILGIKYMTGTIAEKAEYKKTMIPYIVGAVFLCIGGVLIELIFKLVAGLRF